MLEHAEYLEICEERQDAGLDGIEAEMLPEQRLIHLHHIAFAAVRLLAEGW